MNIHTIHIFAITQKYNKSGKPKVCNIKFIGPIKKPLTNDIERQKNLDCQTRFGLWAIISDKLMYQNSRLLREETNR